MKIWFPFCLICVRLSSVTRFDFERKTCKWICLSLLVLHQSKRKWKSSPNCFVFVVLVLNSPNWNVEHSLGEVFEIKLYLQTNGRFPFTKPIVQKASCPNDVTSGENAAPETATLVDHDSRRDAAATNPGMIPRSSARHVNLFRWTPRGARPIHLSMRHFSSRCRATTRTRTTVPQTPSSKQWLWRSFGCQNPQTKHKTTHFLLTYVSCSMTHADIRFFPAFGKQCLLLVCCSCQIHVPFNLWCEAHGVCLLLSWDLCVCLM